MTATNVDPVLRAYWAPTKCFACVASFKSHSPTEAYFQPHFTGEKAVDQSCNILPQVVSWCSWKLESILHLTQKLAQTAMTRDHLHCNDAPCEKFCLLGLQNIYNTL